MYIEKNSRSIAMFIFGILLIFQSFNVSVSGMSISNELLNDTNTLDQSIKTKSKTRGNISSSQVQLADFDYEFFTHDQDLDGTDDSIELRTSLKRLYNGFPEQVYLVMMIELNFWNTTSSLWQPDSVYGNIGSSIIYYIDGSTDLYNGSQFISVHIEGDYQLNITGSISENSGNLDVLDVSTNWFNMDKLDLGFDLTQTESDWDSDISNDTMIMDIEFSYNQADPYGIESLDIRLSMTVEYWDSSTSTSIYLAGQNYQFYLMRNLNNIYSLRITWNAPFNGNFTFKLDLLDLTYSWFKLWEVEFIWDDGNEYIPDYDMWFGEFQTFQSEDADFDGLVDSTKISFTGGVDWIANTGNTMTLEFLLRMYEWNSLTQEWVFFEFDLDSRTIEINSTNSYPVYEFLFRSRADTNYKFEMIVFIDTDVAYSNIVTWSAESVFKGLFYDWDYRTWWVDEDGDGGIDTFNAEFDLRIESIGLIEFTIFIDVYVFDLRDEIIQSLIIPVSFIIDRARWVTHPFSWVSSFGTNNYFLHVYVKNQQNLTIIDFGDDTHQNYREEDWSGFGVEQHDSFITSEPTASDPNISNSSTTDPLKDSENSSPAPFANFLIGLLSLMTLITLRSIRRSRKQFKIMDIQE